MSGGLAGEEKSMGVGVRFVYDPLQMPSMFRGITRCFFIEFNVF